MTARAIFEEKISKEITCTFHVFFVSYTLLNRSIKRKVADFTGTCDFYFDNNLSNYLLLSTLTATVTTSETASAKAAKVINKKLVSNVTIINFLSLNI